MKTEGFAISCAGNERNMRERPSGGCLERGGMEQFLDFVAA
jgi:hypothetical protein